MEGSSVNHSMNSKLIQEYEDLIKSMGAQLKMYEEEHTKLKEELDILMCENEKLSKKLSFELKQRIKDQHVPKIFESEMVMNLKNQLDLCQKEKEKTFELYQSSAKLIKKLEDEIRSHEGCEMVASGLNVVSSKTTVSDLELKLKSVKDRLDVEMTNREQLESECVKYQTEIGKLKLNVEANRDIIDELKEKERIWKDRYTKIEQEYTLLNATLECVSKSRDDLETKLEVSSKRIQALNNHYSEAKRKVEEALELVERAVSERDASLLREGELQKEMNKLHLALKHVIEEAGRKVKEGLEETKKKYDSHINKIMKDVPAMRSELEKKTMELKRMTMKFKRLEKISSTKLDKEKISLIKGSETEITILESQLDSVYKEMERVKLRYEELSGEKAKTEDELSRLQVNYEILLKSKEREEKKMEREIQDLRELLQKKVEDLAEFSKQTEFFLVQVRELQTENRNLGRDVESGKLERLRLKKLIDIRTAQVEELEEHVQSLRIMNEKWKNEAKVMTEEFETRIKEVKKECSFLKRKNREIVKEVDAATKAISNMDQVG